MGDAVFVVIVAAFFTLAALYVRACAGIVGGDAAVAPGAPGDVDKDEAVAA